MPQEFLYREEMKLSENNKYQGYMGLQIRKKKNAIHYRSVFLLLRSHLQYMTAMRIPAAWC